MFLIVVFLIKKACIQKRCGKFDGTTLLKINQVEVSKFLGSFYFPNLFSELKGIGVDLLSYDIDFKIML